ncbi:SIR2 family protein, partial [Candidatus Bathyarchaeota archaeon]|nr:SIR2 family protein [Candidatus Bathyarchaeota archaeon]
LVQKFGYSLLDVSKYDDRGAKVGLFKLHGTVDLFNVEGIVRQRRYMEELGEELIYYPTEFSGYNHVIESPYLELFYLFRERLAQDNAWLIIGSSLRDRTICSIMDSVISLKQENQRPKVILTNPDIDVRNRLALSGFKCLSKSLRHIPRSFGSDEITKEIGQALTEAENG